MDVDPLSRTDAPPRTASFYRGFFDAQQRLPARSADPTFGQSVGAALLTAVPFVAGALFFARRRAAAAAAAAAPTGAKQPAGFFSELLESMRRQMDPMPQRDFRIDSNGSSSGNGNSGSGVRFSDVVGASEAVAEVRRCVEFLRDPQRFARLGARLPRGCLLTGAPGTGKTLLARAVAGEAGVPFFACSGADFIEVFAGSGPKRVRELFAAARRAAPAVVFVDEIDAVGARGGHNSGGTAGEENRTVNQLLAELDGLTPCDAVVVLAATNFAESLDRALLRAGRFDRCVDVPLPDFLARAELFAHYFTRITLDPRLREQEEEQQKQKQREQQEEGNQSKARRACCSQRLARLTPGVSPATIAAIVNEAALQCAARGEEFVTEAALLAAVDDVLVGRRCAHAKKGTEDTRNEKNNEKNNHHTAMTGTTGTTETGTGTTGTGTTGTGTTTTTTSSSSISISISSVSLSASERRRRRAALREGCRAVTAWFLPRQPDVVKVSIAQRATHHNDNNNNNNNTTTTTTHTSASRDGATRQAGREPHDPPTALALFTDVCVMLAARAAETVGLLDGRTTAAGDDCQRATRAAMRLFLSCGMAPERVGLLAFDPRRLAEGRAEQKHSEELSRAAETEAARLIDAAQRFTERVLREREADVRRVADALLAREELTYEELEELLGKRNKQQELTHEAEQALQAFVQRAEGATAL